MDEPVPVTTVRDKLEADLVCDLLRSAGLECGFRLGQTAVSDSAFGRLPPLLGRIQILVHASDLEAAREVIAAVDSP